MEILPKTVPALIESLQKDYPERVARPDDTHGQIMFHAGARALVLKLAYLLEHPLGEED